MAPLEAVAAPARARKQVRRQRGEYLLSELRDDLDKGSVEDLIAEAGARPDEEGEGRG